MHRLSQIDFLNWLNHFRYKVPYIKYGNDKRNAQSYNTAKNQGVLLVCSHSAKMRVMNFRVLVAT